MKALNQTSPGIKLLLLGTGESGKSTVFKQAKILYDNGFATPQEREPYKPAIYSNVIEAMKKLLVAAEKREKSVGKDCLEAAARILRLQLVDPLTVERGKDIAQLWSDEVIKTVFKEEGSRLHLSDNVAIYFRDIARISHPNYLPTADDIVLSRVRTSGIVETVVLINRVKFKFVDVGGQRGERRKWIHSFSNVQAVLFVAAISEYDQYLQEDNSKNRLLEALDLFKEICHHPSFTTTHMIVFLNKSDLFEKKMLDREGRLEDIFPEYDGGYYIQKAIEFIIRKFWSIYHPNRPVPAEVVEAATRNEGPSFPDVDNMEPGAPRTKDIYFHVTCATNKNNMILVFSSVQNIILKQNLDECKLF